MFVGHYGPAYAARRWAPEVPVFVLFLAVQLVDIAWAVLVLLGVEKVRIVPGITATNPLDFYYMPYSHSLLAAVVWSVVAGVVYVAWKTPDRKKRVGAAIAAAVFSHWILDLVVHRPDLSLLGGHNKVGLGLWDYPVAALVVEIGVLVGGLLVYTKSTRPCDGVGRFAPSVLVVVLAAVQIMMFFGAPPKTPQQAAVAALVAYFAFAGAAAWIDHHREPGFRPELATAS
jgi:hypothetical protein